MSDPVGTSVSDWNAAEVERLRHELGKSRRNEGYLKHPLSDRWVPFYDAQGNPVTLTWEQVRAVFHCIEMVNDLRCTEPRQLNWPETVMEPTIDIAGHPWKSRALGRLLIQGKPLFVDKPPLSVAACDYDTWDRENEDGQEAVSGDTGE